MAGRSKERRDFPSDVGVQQVGNVVDPSGLVRGKSQGSTGSRPRGMRSTTPLDRALELLRRRSLHDQYQNIVLAGWKAQQRASEILYLSSVPV